MKELSNRTVVIKEWKARQINEDMSKYKWLLEADWVDDELNRLENVTVYLTEPVLRESEKAIYVNVYASNYSDVLKDFKTWIPKSAIVEMHV